MTFVIFARMHCIFEIFDQPKKIYIKNIHNTSEILRLLSFKKKNKSQCVCIIRSIIGDRPHIKCMLCIQRKIVVLIYKNVSESLKKWIHSCWFCLWSFGIIFILGETCFVSRYSGRNIKCIRKIVSTVIRHLSFTAVNNYRTKWYWETRKKKKILLLVGSTVDCDMFLSVWQSHVMCADAREYWPNESASETF